MQLHGNKPRSVWRLFRSIARTIAKRSANPVSRPAGQRTCDALPLKRAFRHADAGCWDELINANPDSVDCTDETGESLLCRCVRIPWSDAAVELLIHPGADLNESKDDGSNLLTSAIYRSGNAHGSNTLTVVEILLKHGADPNKIADAGMPALHWAVANGRFEAARLLVQFGADLSLLTSDDPPESIHEIARRRGYSTQIEQILGADQN